MPFDFLQIPFLCAVNNRVLYNVTVNVDADIESQWLEWMKHVHIPAVMATGFFLENKICRIHAFEDGGVSYAIQYLCAGMNDLEEYQRDYAPRLQEEHTQKFNGKFVAFRTVLEIVHEHQLPTAGVYPN